MTRISKAQRALLEEMAKDKDGRTWLSDQARGKCWASAWWRTGRSLVDRGLAVKCYVSFEITPDGRRALGQA